MTVVASNYARKENDLYQTEPWATEALLRVLRARCEAKTASTRDEPSKTDLTPGTLKPGSIFRNLVTRIALLQR